MQQNSLKIIGHRGSAGLAHENTLEAIKAGIAAGVHGVEFDVRVTKDGIPVLSHNRFVLHEGKMHVISAGTYSELQRAMPSLATLSQALELIGGRVVPMIEIKAGEPVEPVVAVVRLFSGITYGPESIQIGSKSQKTLRAVHTALPDVPVVVIESWSGVIAAWRARQVGTRRLYMRSWWLWSGFLSSMQRRGYQISAYTLNNPGRALRWQKYLEGVVTDYPTRYLQAEDNQDAAGKRNI